MGKGPAWRLAEVSVEGWMRRSSPRCMSPMIDQLIPIKNYTRLQSYLSVI